MTDKAIFRLAQIAHEYDLAGRPREADIIAGAMLRLADDSAVGNWWNGVKNVGQGLEDDAKAAGNAIAMPFEGVGAAASAAWNQGIKNVPAAAQQAEGQAWDRAKNYTSQEFRDYAQAAPALAGPGGTGLPGAVVTDAAHGAASAVQNAAQGYVGGLVNQQIKAQQAAYVQNVLQQAIHAHRTTGTGWQVIHNVVTYGNLTPEMQTILKQEFATAARFAPEQH